MRLLAGFELEQMKQWYPKMKLENGVHVLDARRKTTLSDKDVSDGKHAWKIVLKKLDMDWKAKKNYPAIRFCQSRGLAFCGYSDRYWPNYDIALFFGESL